MLGIMLSALLICGGAPALADADPEHSMHHETPAWAEQLKGQTIVEDVQEGHAERTAMMERQHQRIMEKMNEQMTHDTNLQRTDGYYNNVNMMHHMARAIRMCCSCPIQVWSRSRVLEGGVPPMLRSNSTTSRRSMWRSA